MFIRKPQEPSRLVTPYSTVVDVEELLNTSDETQLLLKIQKFLKIGLRLSVAFRITQFLIVNGG